MIIKTRSFLKFELGIDEYILSLKQGSRVSDAINQFAEENGVEIKKYLFDRQTGDCRVIFSVNKRGVSLDYVLKENDELVILPPLAGG